MSKKIHLHSHTAKLLGAVFLLLGLSSQAWALNKVVTVSATAGRGDFTTIQAAVNNCDPLQDVCTINLVDNTYSLMGPIWIEGRANITIQGATTSGVKPLVTYNTTLYGLVANPNNKPQVQQAQVLKLFTLSWADISGGAADPMRPAGWLMWPFIGEPDGTQVNGPYGASTDATDSFSTSGFQHNGMIVIKKSQDITIRGLKLVAQPKVFQNTKVWNQKYDIVFGTVGINLMQSLRVVVDNNDISNFFSAMYINGRNPGGMFGNANPSDINRNTIVPLSRYGQVGNHNIQRNYIHDNWWCFYGESMWDLSNRIHHNVTYNNMNKNFQYGDTIKVADAKTDEMNNQTGGFYYLKDQVLAADRVYNNTILRSPIVFGFGGWRAGSQELFYNNVVRTTKELTQVTQGDFHQLMQNYGHTVWNNTFQMTPVVGVTKKATIDNLTVKDTGLVGIYGATSNCGGGCNLAANYSYVQQIQPMFLWNSWAVKQYLQDSVDGSKLLSNGALLSTLPAVSGYAGKMFTFSSTNAYAAWGLVNKMSVTPRQMDSVASLPRRNFYAFYLPTALDTGKPVDTTFVKATPANVMTLAPLWDSLTNKSAILNQAWNNDNTGNTDGTAGNRGAFCYDTGTGKTTVGCSPSGSVLSLVDQQITSVQATAVKIPLLVGQVNGQTGAAVTGAFSDFKVDSVYYYHGFPWSNLDSTYQATDHSQEPYVMPTKITNTTWNGTTGSMLAFNIAAPLAATEDVVRFEVFMSALDPSTGKRVSVIGIYFYRKLQYQLQVQFCSDSLCTKVITEARVGDKLYMQAIVLNASGVAQPTTSIYNVYGNPSTGSSERNLLTGNYINSNDKLLSTFTGKFSIPVDFEVKGSQSVSLTGLVGSTSSATSILGVGSINIRPGLPYQVQFLTPQTYQVKKCNENPSDTANGCNELQGVVPNQGILVVYDKYGNAVDQAATVTVSAPGIFSGPIANPVAVTGSVAKVGATQGVVASGTSSADVQTDATGNATFWVSGDPGTAGQILYSSGKFPWIQLSGIVQAAGVAPADVAYARLDPPAGHLAWQSPAKVEAYILTSVPVVLILTKDGTTVDAGNPNANAKVGLYPASSTYIKAYADAAMTIPLDSVQLVGGTASFWVASSRPTGNDSLYAASAALTPTPGLPVHFTSPPVPPTPTLKSALFTDGNCDGIADIATVTFDPAGAVPTLDTTKVKINRIKLSTASGDSVILDATNFTVAAGGASISVTLPSTAQAKFAAYNPSGVVELWANLVRPPAADTNVYMGKATVTDGIGPRPTAATIVENSVPGSADTLKVQFSEPVNYTGTAFPFHLFPASMSPEISNAGLAVSSSTGSGTKSLTFIVTGNAGALAAGDVLAIFTGRGIADAAGNDGRYTQCGNDTATIRLVPVAVPLTSAWISDTNGDGKADQITVVFRRPFLKTSEVPDNLVVTNWINTPTATLLWSLADSVAPGKYTFPISFPEGATVGGSANGSGTITLNQGPIRSEASPLIDSVPPVAVGVAKLSHGLTNDTLTVTYSEPVKPVAGAITMGKKSATATDDPLVLTIPGQGTVLTYVITPGYVLAGDSIRMSITKSMLAAADNGQLPAGSGAAPYIPVAGGDRAPDSAIVLDLNGNGTADAVRLVYLKPLIGNPTFTFTWGNVTVKVDSTMYSKTLAGTNGAVLTVSGFPAGVTVGPGQGTSTSLVAGTPSSPLPFALIDGVAPVLNSIFVSYGKADGTPDTITLKVSEPLSSPPQPSSFLTILRKGVVHPFLPSDPGAQVKQIDATTFQILCDSCMDGAGFFGLPGFGDSAKLMKGVKDAPLNAVADSSRWVPVLTGPYPVRYNATVYPSGGIFVSKDNVLPEIVNLPDVTSWILPVGPDSSGTWTSVDPAGNGGLTTIDAGTAKGGLFGVKITLNTSFDGQILFYDNLGVFVGKVDLKTRIEDLRQRGLVGPDGKYTLVATLHDNDDKTRHLASGVFMARLISFSVQTVNGVQQRVMIQNKLFKVGYKKNLK